tara:strand:+ start:185 stop:598 length:414 start_codon:yes stop_codon:yes gene_type:complete
MQQEGKFITDKSSTNLALAVRFSTKEEQSKFIRSYTAVNSEMFLRYYRPSPNFRKIMIGSVGDHEDTRGIVNWSKSAMCLNINCTPVNKREQRKLEDSNQWIIMLSYFVGGTLKDIYRFAIDKESEFITSRDFMILD